MIISRNIKNIRNILVCAKKRNKLIGFVPTMGALHDGHLSLVRKAKKECSFTVVSIFVNPSQFGPGEDFFQYPRTFKQDRELLKKEKVDLIFYPSAENIYQKDFSTYVQEKALSENLCGRSRPGHFRGVCTIVAKLFNIIQPDKAYFGQKDLQQARIIERMTRDLNIPVRIRICPIIREKDGLAMSSRNRYLSKEDREKAPAIYKTLSSARSEVNKGERSALKIKKLIEKMLLSRIPEAKIDYISIVDHNTLKDLKKIEGKVAIVIAVYIGKTRLIDNIIVRV